MIVEIEGERIAPFSVNDLPEKESLFTESVTENREIFITNAATKLLIGLNSQYNKVTSVEQQRNLETAQRWIVCSINDAMGLIDVIAPQQAYVDTGDTRNYERVWLMLALTKQWQEAGTDLQKRIEVSKRFCHLYDPTIVQTEISSSISAEVNMRGLIRKTWPESNGSKEWARKHKATPIKHAKNGASIVRFPYSYAESELKIREVYDEYGIPPEHRRLYGGRCDTDTHTVYSFIEGIPYPEYHEEAHAKCHSIHKERVSLLFEEIHAQLTATEKEWGDPFFEHNFINSDYFPEITLWYQITRQYPELMKLLKKRCRNGSVESAVNFDSAFIRIYGIDNYAEAHFTLPGMDYFTEKQREMETAISGLYPTERLYHLLGEPTEFIERKKEILEVEIFERQRLIKQFSKQVKKYYKNKR